MEYLISDGVISVMAFGVVLMLVPCNFRLTVVYSLYIRFLVFFFQQMAYNTRYLRAFSVAVAFLWWLPCLILIQPLIWMDNVSRSVCVNCLRGNWCLVLVLLTH